MQSLLRKHLSYANVAATLALVFSMSAGAVAATHYIINTTKQINPKVIRKLRGTSGPTGPRGLTGPQGPGGSPGAPGAPGATGPSVAFNTNSGESFLGFASTENETQIVSSLSLPAGNFALFAKLNADNDGPEALARCQLHLGATVIDSGFSGASLGTVPTDRQYIFLAGTGSITAPGTARIICNVDGVDGKYLDRSITAIQVGSLR